MQCNINCYYYAIPYYRVSTSRSPGFSFTQTNALELSTRTEKVANARRATHAVSNRSFAESVHLFGVG